MRKSHARDSVAARTGRDVDELLKELYVEKGYNFIEIGKALGVSRELVRQWVNDAGLQRPPAEAVL
jgi:transposase-like protein